MGVLNIIKGAYPSLQQIDKPLPVAEGESGIVRGSLMYVDSSEYKLAGSAQKGDASTPGAFLYISLIPQDDLTAGMAGSVGQGAGGGKATINGLAISMPMEIETDQYTEGGALSSGQFVTIGDNGKFVAHASNDTCYGQVTVATKVRWANDAIAVTGWRTGNKVNVIRVRTMYIPSMVTSA